jgi:hypothetical protein
LQVIYLHDEFLKAAHAVKNNHVFEDRHALKTEVIFKQPNTLGVAILVTTSQRHISPPAQCVTTPSQPRPGYPSPLAST